MTPQRDLFISKLFKKAKHDKDIYLLSVDMGAPSLDRWRAELPSQFFAAGISGGDATRSRVAHARAGRTPREIPVVPRPASRSRVPGAPVVHVLSRRETSLILKVEQTQERTQNWLIYW